MILLSQTLWKILTLINHIIFRVMDPPCQTERSLGVQSRLKVILAVSFKMETHSNRYPNRDVSVVCPFKSLSATLVLSWQGKD